MELRRQIHTPAALSQTKNKLCPLKRRLNELQSRYGRSGKRKNFLHLPGIEFQLVQQVG